MQASDFESFATDCFAFGIDPTELLGIKHSVTRVDFLAACRLAAERVRSKEKISEIKFSAEITAVRVGHQVGRLWDGRDIPSMDEIFANADDGAISNRGGRHVVENGKEYVIDNGIKFEVLK